MPLPAAIFLVCRRWCATAPLSVAPLGTQGFSGSQVFVVEFPSKPDRFVLKRLYAGASIDHARFVHGLARHLRAEGNAEVPEVIPALDGDTVVVDADGRLWELCRFMTGVPVPCPTPAQAAAAATALARLHLAAASLPGHPSRAGISPGVERRIDRARRLLTHPWQDRRGAWSQRGRTHPSDDTAAAIEARIATAIATVNACRGEELLARVAALRPDPCVLQPVLRDVWCDHVLFAEGRDHAVTAIIDLHAAGIDTPATDLARLVGSWTAPPGDERLSLGERWGEAFAAYVAVRPLSAVEATLVPMLHATGVVFGLDNWFRWTMEEQRVFSDPRKILERIDRLLDELPAAIAAAWSHAGNVD